MENKKQILLVDDNERSLKLLKALYEVDYRVLTATDGLEALEILFEHKVDLVITDVLMPNMDGYFLCYKIRTRENLKDLPIIIYTATYTSLSEENVAREMGANLFIRKPAAIKFLLSSAEELIKNKEKYPHKIPTRQESTEMMHQYNTKLVTKLEQNNIELNEMKNRLEQSEARLKEAQAIAHIGNYEIDMINDVDTWSDELYHIFGFSRGEVAGNLQTFLSVLHPGDANEVKKKVDQSFESLKGSSLSFRFIRKDGEVRHGYSEWRFGFDMHHKPTRLYGIIHDVTESKKAEIRIQELNEHLEERVSERTAELMEANKALEGFSYSVSHDLRAPLRTIVGFTKIIQKDYAKSMSPDLHELFTHIEGNGKRMSAIIEDLLNLAKYGKEQLKVTTVDMTGLFKFVWNNIIRLSPGNAVFEMTELPSVEGDLSMLEQVLVNLLTNAHKYSSKKENPVVSVGFKDEGATISYFVKDNGAGFDMKNYEKLFGAFQRLHSTSEFEGTGVGLLLVKRIIDKHGGKVWAEGQVGEGATFWFSLPKTIAQR